MSPPNCWYYLGHSGRLKRLSGCSPSATVFRYLLPELLFETITFTVVPPLVTWKDHLPESIPVMASCWSNFQRDPSWFIPPIFMMRSCGLKRSDLLMHLTSILVIVLSFDKVWMPNLTWAADSCAINLLSSLIRRSTKTFPDRLLKWAAGSRVRRLF